MADIPTELKLGDTVIAVLESHIATGLLSMAQRCGSATVHRNPPLACRPLTVRGLSAGIVYELQLILEFHEEAPKR